MSSNSTNPTARTVASTQSEMTEIILPNDTNTLGNLLGGRLMHFHRSDRRHGRLPALTHPRGHRRHGPHRLHPPCASWRPGHPALQRQPRLFHLHGGGRQGLGGNTRTGSVAHVASAYLVFVAIDDQGTARVCLKLLPETADEQRRYEGALRRRENREAESARRKQAKLDSDAEEALQS
jgi:hypothetical protein